MKLFARLGLVTVALIGAGSLYFWLPHWLHPADTGPEAADAATGTLPIDAFAPWPKFRANALQTGRVSWTPTVDATRKPWTFQTGKGIFSSPVIDAEGTVYIGSADQNFYAIGADGREKWRVATGEIIDSSALLDDAGRVIVGSGDGHVYAIERATGKTLWKSAAHSTAAVEKEFGVKTYNVNWFEGNIGMLPDGTLLAPNDNYLVYHLDRATGARKTQYVANEMVWSLPAVNPATGRLFFGSANLALRTLFAYDWRTHERQWVSGGLGSVAASPLLTSSRENGAVIVGGFDGFVRAYRQRDGREIWATGLRDHIYASPAQLADGTLIQPGADGTVYALHPADGRILWQFDTQEPIRSSPAVDGNGVIYVGSGEGRLFAINPDGTLRWSYRLISEPRNDLNSSPALGPQGVVIAGENGGVFMVPYDYCLSAAGRADARCTQGPGEALAQDGVFLLPTDGFGTLDEKAGSIDANQALTFSLFVRENGDSVLAELERDSLQVEVSGGAKFTVDVAAHRRFVTLTPRELWPADKDGTLTVTLRGRTTVGMKRFGLKFFGGQRGKDFTVTHRFTFNRRPASADLPYAVPTTPGEAGTVFELSRLSVPNPTMLPSWNQIGFDSLHYLAGTVAKQGARTLLWVVGGKLDQGVTTVDPGLQVRYPLWLDWHDGLVTLSNYDGFKINFVGSWDMPFASYRVSAPADASGRFTAPATLSATALCDEIAFYGKGLKLMGMSEFDTGKMTVFGGLNLSVWNAAVSIPAIQGVRFSASRDEAVAQIDATTLPGNAHVYSLLVTDTQDQPLPLYYTRDTSVDINTQGQVTAVRVKLDGKAAAGSTLRLRLMVDTQLAAQSEVIRP